MNNEQFEVEVAQIVHDLILRLESGGFAEIAAERKLQDRVICAAMITEMCRQAFTGEWEETK